MHQGEDGAPPDPDLEPVVHWATNRLRAAGLSPQLAVTVARDCANDLARILDVAAILELVDRGCTPEVAVRIVGPVNEQDDARTAR